MRPSEYRLLQKLFDEYMKKALDKRKEKCDNLPSGKQLFSKGKKK